MENEILEGNKLITKFIGTNLLFNLLTYEEKESMIIDFHRNSLDDLSSIEESILTQYINNYLTPATLDDVDFNLSIVGFKDWFEDNCDLKFHSSWSWLMLVVEKIEQSSINIIGRYEDVIINGCSCLIHLIDDDIVTIGTTKKEAVFEAIVKFIKWYNNNKNKM